MTEYEIIQNYYACTDIMATYVINFVSILSGYLLATYFLGKKNDWGSIFDSNPILYLRYGCNRFCVVSAYQ